MEPITNNPRGKWGRFRGGFSGSVENGEGQNSSPAQQETNGENWRIVESGGGVTIVEEINGLVGEECMGLMEEQVQMVRKVRKR